jgi:LysM repeat protein/ABC-type branched-subunit amino acid transport system substrate-binding protein
MKSILSVIVLLIFTGFFFDSSAQQIRENELVIIKGEKFVLHQVRTGETIYSITRQFNVDREELIEHNPDIAAGLKIGDILKIPYKEGTQIQNTTVSGKGDPTRFIFHTITSRKQTPYFIAKEYDITVEQIYAYNPEVKRFKRGTKLRIPVWEEAKQRTAQKIQNQDKQTEVPDDEGDELIKHQVSSGETLFSIARRYNISESEILFYNPGARNLKAGSIIYLPKDAEDSAIDDKISQPIDLDEDLTARADLEMTVGNYFNHTIVSGETLWGLTRKYDVTEQELKRINPVLESGFPAGVTIKIPVEDEDLKRPEPVNEEAFIEHLVRSGETLYGLAREYDLTIPEIKKFNPVLEKRNLVQGETILIPRKPDEEIISFMEEIEPEVEADADVDTDSLTVEAPQFESDFYEIEVPLVIPENCRPRNNSIFNNQVYEVALFLPLYTLANDTLNREIIIPDSLLLAESIENELDDELLPENDTVIEEELTKEMFHGFYRNSENFLQFYEGVLIAVDSMQQAGMNIRLNVYDTQQNPDSIRDVIYSEDFLRTDLIIGPVFPNVQKELSEIASKMRIPMVSPLAPESAGLSSNPYLFQVNPSRDYLAMKTAELVAEEYFNSNFIVFETGSSSHAIGEKVVEITKEKLYQSGYWGQSYGVDFNIYDFDEEGPFGFRRILSRTKENVVFVPSLNEGEVSVALSNINNLADDYSITLIGFNRYEQFSSIDLEFYYNLKLHYIDPYWINYDNPATIKFIEKFKSHFYTEPNNFGIQGYDVAFYFLNAIYNYGKDFEECLPYNQAELIQGNYRFEKVSPFGGYMNEGVSVITYQRNFDIVRKRILGQYRYAQN